MDADGSLALVQFKSSHAKNFPDGNWLILRIFLKISHFSPSEHLFQLIDNHAELHRSPLFSYLRSFLTLAIPSIIYLTLLFRFKLHKMTMTLSLMRLYCGSIRHCTNHHGNRILFTSGLDRISSELQLSGSGSTATYHGTAVGALGF